MDLWPTALAHTTWYAFLLCSKPHQGAPIGQHHAMPAAPRSLGCRRVCHQQALGPAAAADVEHRSCCALQCSAPSHATLAMPQPGRSCRRQLPGQALASTSAWSRAAPAHTCPTINHISARPPVSSASAHVCLRSHECMQRLGSSACCCACCKGGPYAYLLPESHSLEHDQ